MLTRNASTESEKPDVYIVVAVKFAIMGSRSHDAYPVVAAVFAIMGSGRTRVLSATTLFAPLRDAWIMVTNFLAHGLCVIT